MKALRRLTLALCDRVLDVQRTDVFHLFLNVTSELETMAHANLRLKKNEASALTSGEIVDERFTIRRPSEWLKKLDRIVGDLARRKSIWSVVFG